MNKSLIKKPTAILALAAIILVSLFAVSHIKSSKILGQKSQTIVVSSSPSVSPQAAFHTVTTIESTPSPVPIKLSKSTFTIALFGDSMIDTMGDMKYLSVALAKRYPDTKFNLYNYGIGAQNVQMGLDRVDSAFNYQSRTYPPISQTNADIIIVGSFAYNPFVNHDVNRFSNTLTALLNKVRSFNKNVYQLIEIAPLKDNFGKGPHGINWPPDLALKQSLHIDEQLVAARSVAKNLNVPTIDVYPFSTGRTMYTNPDDGIHPSVDGHTLIANIIVKTIILK